MQSIYLDYSTSTPVAASVRECMLPFLNEFYGHPSSRHWYGRAAQEAVEDARSHIAALIGCHPSEIVFTSGGTESVNLGILGVGRAIGRSQSEEKPHIIISNLEHASVRKSAEQLESEGWQLTFVGCDEDGIVILPELKEAIRPETRLMSVIHASHRIGTIQPIAEIAEICQNSDVLFHTDAAQSIGKIDCNVEALGVDLLSLSGHKFYAPKGVGVLYSRLGVPLEPLWYGEGGDAGLRVGTANVPGIVGLGQAAKLARQGLESSLDRTAQLRDRFHLQLENMLGVAIKVHGANVDRVPGILSLEIPGVSAEALQRRIPEICFGPCAAEPCSVDTKHQLGTESAVPENLSSSRKLQAFGPTEQQSANTLRLSFGWTTSEDELHQAVQLIAAAYESLASQ